MYFFHICICILFIFLSLFICQLKIPSSTYLRGLPRLLSGKESTCQCRRHRRHEFNPWVRMILWRWKWQPTLVFLPGQCHGQRSLEGFKGLDMTFDMYQSILIIIFLINQFSSVQSCPTLRPHELQHTRPPCPSSTPRVHSNSRPSSR